MELLKISKNQSIKPLKMRNIFIVVFGIISFSVLSSACSSKVDLKNVNLENWKNDRDGCIGLRMQELEAFYL